jgi:hypothetical protein
MTQRTISTSSLTTTAIGESLIGVSAVLCCAVCVCCVILCRTVPLLRHTARPFLTVILPLASPLPLLLLLLQAAPN